MELRTELSDAQKDVEPHNADSHLTYLGAGLRNCVTYRTRPDAPVYFIDLDGTNDVASRRRTTIVVGTTTSGSLRGSSVQSPRLEAPDRFGQPGRFALRAARSGE